MTALTKKTLRAAFREARENPGRKVAVDGLGNVWAERVIKSRKLGIVGTIYWTDSKLFEVPGRPEVTSHGGWDLEHGLEVITRKARQNEPSEAMDFEMFAARRGGSRQDFGEAGAHKRSRRQTDKQWNRIIKRITERGGKLEQKREGLRQEYDRLVEQGVIRPLTPKERLMETASGHPDNDSVQAARRVLTKRYGVPMTHWEKG